VETEKVRSIRAEPVRRQPVPERRAKGTRWVGRLRLPIAGPYRPWARLYRLPDGRLTWTVRLWEVDRATVRRVDTEVLRAFARANRLTELLDAIEALVRRAEAGGRP
jgi:hypothetical protein